MEYGQAKSVTISPVKKEEFIRNLRERGVSDRSMREVTKNSGDMGYAR
jgi:hypothetical protein